MSELAKKIKGGGNIKEQVLNASSAYSQTLAFTGVKIVPKKIFLSVKAMNYTGYTYVTNYTKTDAISSLSHTNGGTSETTSRISYSLQNGTLTFTLSSSYSTYFGGEYQVVLIED
jgi:hypothetical protein